MKNFILTISLFFLVATTYAQNYSFMQLIEMTNDSKLFEINMIKGLNQMHKKDKIITYSYSLNGGGVGASRKLPTNDTKYEPKYRFDNGNVYTNSEIEDQKLDESLEIRYRLRKKGNLSTQLHLSLLSRSTLKDSMFLKELYLIKKQLLIQAAFNEMKVLSNLRLLHNRF